MTNDAEMEWDCARQIAIDKRVEKIRSEAGTIRRHLEDLRFIAKEARVELCKLEIDLERLENTAEKLSSASKRK